MLLQTILEGLGLGALLVLVCAVGIRKGAVGMVHLYDQKVQERCVALGMTTKEKIKRNALRFKAVCIPVYLAYVLICVYAINGAQGFWDGFWQCFVILSVMNLIDRFLIDGYWVGHTKAWLIPGTEDLMPYITKADKQKKWLAGTVGMAVISAVIAGIGMLMYKTKRSLLGKIMSCVLAVAMLMSMSAVSAFAATPTEAGNYTVEATLSCYVNAMGGVEFSDGYGLLTGITVTVADDGNATATINLGTTSGLSVYGVPCTAFIGTNEAPGYYKDGAVTKENVTYTTSTDTVANASGQVNYITSITLPVETATSEYTMWLYLDSNVMGCQLGDGSGTGASNTPGVATKHTAKLTIDWESAVKNVEATESKNQSAKVEYTVEGGYEVEIPATITVDATTKKGEYTVTAKNFVIGENAYVTVTASESGKLTNGADELAFTNTLAEGKLTKSGDTLAGTVEVTDSPSNPGKYTGTIDFVINYYAGA